MCMYLFSRGTEQEVNLPSNQTTRHGALGHYAKHLLHGLISTRPDAVAKRPCLADVGVGREGDEAEQRDGYTEAGGAKRTEALGPSVEFQGPDGGGARVDEFKADDDALVQSD